MASTLRTAFGCPSLFPTNLSGSCQAGTFDQDDRLGALVRRAAEARANLYEGLL